VLLAPAVDWDRPVGERDVLGHQPEPAPRPVAVDGWKRDDDGGWPYVKDGAKVSRWIQDADGYWYYLSHAHDGSFGSLALGWIFDAGFWYCLSAAHGGSFGHMLTGWQQVAGSRYYLYPEPACSKLRLSAYARLERVLGA